MPALAYREKLAVLLGDRSKYPGGLYPNEQGKWGKGDAGNRPIRAAGDDELTPFRAKLYAGHIVNAKKVVHVSKAVLEGQDVDTAAQTVGATEDHILAARAMVQAVRTATKVEKPLYRGIGAAYPIGSLERAKVGQTLTLGQLSSFSGDEDTARDYAETSSTYVSGHPVIAANALTYLLKVEGPVQAVATDELTGMTHQEYVTTGEFEVVAVDDDDMYEGRAPAKRVITIRQKNVF